MEWRHDVARDVFCWALATIIWKNIDHWRRFKTRCWPFANTHIEVEITIFNNYPRHLRGAWPQHSAVLLRDDHVCMVHRSMVQLWCPVWRRSADSSCYMSKWRWWGLIVNPFLVVDSGPLWSKDARVNWREVGCHFLFYWLFVCCAWPFTYTHSEEKKCITFKETLCVSSLLYQFVQT